VVSFRLPPLYPQYTSKKRLGPQSQSGRFGKENGITSIRQRITLWYNGSRMMGQDLYLDSRRLLFVTELVSPSMFGKSAYISLQWPKYGALQGSHGLTVLVEPHL
jgi:hypothetical protein